MFAQPLDGLFARGRDGIDAIRGEPGATAPSKLGRCHPVVATSAVGVDDTGQVGAIAERVALSLGQARDVVRADVRSGVAEPV